ncbi:MAG: hypothetical protein J5850_05940, partial [Clostridia bacterium]|nr:hypothetical protein [Clostridia bacterium]
MSIILLIISGLCTALSIQYKALYFLSYIGLIPYYCFLIQSRKVNRKGLSLYGYGLIWSMSFYMTVYTFFFYMYPMSFLDCTKAEAIFIILFCWIALSMLQAVPMALAAPLFKAISGKTAFAPLIFASLITIFEWLQNFTWAGVPFVRLAVSQVSFAPAAQSASLLGSLFLSFFTAAVNGYLGNGILYFAKEKNRSLGLISCVIALASVMINTGYGLIRIAVTEKADSQKEKIKVAAIQGNISSLDKWNSSLLDGILDKYIDMTYEAADNGAQMIVYPESAMNYYIKSGEGTEARTRIRNICKEYGITAVIGAFDCGYNMKKEFVTYNALVTFYPDGLLEEFPYYKR